MTEPASPPAAKEIRGMNVLRPMWHKPEGWSRNGPALNGWIEGHETRHLKKLWDFLMAEEDFDPGCFLAEAIQMEMQYRGEGGYVAL